MASNKTIEFNGDLGVYLEEIQQKKIEKKRSNWRADSQRRRKDPEKNERIKESRRNWYRKRMLDPENRKAESRRIRRRKYKISDEEQNRIYAEQEGKCAICGVNKPLYGGTKDSLCVDHDHDNGRVRGLLCGSCNYKLGILEQKDWEKKARAYLKRHES